MSWLCSRLRSWGSLVGGEPCQWALTENRARSGGGAPQGGNLRLIEDGSERGGALVSDLVAPNTASEGQDGNGESTRVNGR